jgi:hypothetical protein
MQKQKLRLDELQVESFVTTTRINGIGGVDWISQNFACDNKSDGECPGYVTNGHCAGFTDFACYTYGLICLTRQNWCGIPTINDNCFTRDPNQKCNDFT